MITSFIRLQPEQRLPELQYWLGEQRSASFGDDDEGF